MADSNEATGPKWIQAVRALAWPVLTLFLVVSFWTPIHKIADTLPDLVGRSETISIAGVQLEVKGRLRAQASEEVTHVLSELNELDLTRLMSDSSAAYTSEPGGGGMIVDYQRLVDLGCFEEIPQSELPTDGHEPYSYGVRPTGLGLEVREFLISVVLEAIPTSGS